MSTLKDLANLAKQVNANKKAGVSYSQSQSKKEDEDDKISSLKDLARKVNDGTIKVGSNYNSSKVDAWFSGAKSVYDEGYSYLSKEGYKAPNQDILKSIDDYLNQSSEVGMFLRANKNMFDDYDSAYKSYVDSVTYLNSLRRALNESNSVFSQWKTEDDYKNDISGWLNPNAETNETTVAMRKEKYESNKKRIEEIKQQLPWIGKTFLPTGVEKIFLNKDADALKDEWEALEAENNQYLRTQGALDKYYVPETEEFLRNGAYRNYTNASRDELRDYNMSVSEGSEALNNGGYVDEDGHIRDAKGNIVQYSRESVVQDKLGLYLASTEEEADDERYKWASQAGLIQNTWLSFIDEGNDNGWKYLKPYEINIYYDLMKREGQESAYKFLDTIAPTLTQRATQARTDWVNQQDGWTQFGLNVASIPMNVFGGALALGGDAIDFLSGKEYNPYSQAHMLVNLASDIRTKTATDINTMTGNAALPWVGTTWGDVYQSIMSAGDSALGIALGGNAYGTLMGMGAASSEMKRLYDQGASMGQIAAGGILAGAAEMVFEKYSIDQLVSMGDTKTIRAFVLNILKQGGIEASEEMATEIANTITNAIVMGSQSDWVDVNTFAKNVVNAGIGGFISGGFSGGGGAAINAIGYNIKAAEYGQDIIDQGGVDELQNLAMEMVGAKGLNSKAIGKMSNKVSSKATAGRVGKLADMIGETNTAQSKAEIQEALIKQGLSKKEAKRVTEYLYDATQGKEFTEEQGEEVENNDKIRKVYSDLIGKQDSAVNTRTQKLAHAVHKKTIEEAALRMTFESLGMKEDDVQKAIEKTFTPEGKMKVATNGKAIDKDGNDIDIKGVYSIYTDTETKKPVLLLETADGKTVKASEVSFANDKDAIVYEAIANLGNKIDADTANKFLKQFDGGDAMVFAKGMAQAYAYGFYGLSKSELMGKTSLATELTEEQRNVAYGLGKQYRSTYDKAVLDKAKATTTAPSEKGVFYRDKDGNATDIKSYLEQDKRVLNEMQKTGIEWMEKMSEMMGVRFNVFESWVENGQRYYLDEDGVKQAGSPNGFYDPKTGEIYIDLYAGNDFQGTMLFTIAHELTHFMRRWSPEHFTKIARIVFQHGSMKGSVAELVALKQARAKAKGKPISYDTAMEEVVADGMETILKNGKVTEFMADVKKQDHKAWAKLKEWFANFAEFLRKFVGAYSTQSAQTQEGARVAAFSRKLLSQIEQIFAEGAIVGGENYQSAVGGEVDLDGDSNTHLLSDKSIIEGAGLQFIPDEDGTHYTVLDANGNEVKNVTSEMIADSPLGDLVTIAKENGFLGEGRTADLASAKQYKFLADLVNMCIRYDGIAPIWETAGTMVFSSIKSNADKQYGLTIDFSTVCKKTQAIVDAMSEAMVRLGRGLTRSEVETIYLEVGKAGESTPCPVCYVFSRWMGIGGILDQINRYQDKYYNMSEAKIQSFISDVKGRIDERANTPNSAGKLKADFFDKNGAVKEGSVIADLKQKANARAASALKALAKNSDYQLQIQELEVLMENQDAKEAKKTAKKIEKLKAKLVDASELESQFKHYNDVVEEYEAYQWLTRTLMKEENGKWVKNEDFKPVPPEVLFDLNNGATFAEEYPLSWAFRTGKGASAGKAITPYADARVGEAIQGIASQDVKEIKTGIDINPFLNGDKKTRQSIINKAIVKQARQNLIGGQRYQSTSDFRYEYGSDYLITFLEMQAIGAKVQLYTKVIEAVDFLASMGADVNLSVMPLSNGFVTLPDGTKKLIYSSVTGIDKDAALSKVHEYDNVQLILVGISDEHIRLALEGEDVTFVIPFHGSGNTVHQIQVLMNLLGENLDVTTAQDYTAVQSDHVSPKQTKEQKAMWNLRVKIITGKASTLSTAEYELLENNSYLKDLHRRFYIDKSADEYGISLTSDQANQIFPYEYWDKSLTYDKADMNGERFKEYCASMGIIPRFSGKNSKGESVGFGDFTGDKGYWKLLIDRRMYDNTYDSNGNWTGYGKYHVQKRINCSDFQVKHLDPAYGSATYGDVMSKANDPKKTSAIVDRAIAQFENKETMLSDRDNAYLDVVKRNDMETAQKMADAAAKEAGFPVKVFHGTKQFGFTRPNVKKSDDGISFFATEDIGVAGSYSGITVAEERKISDSNQKLARKDVPKLSNQVKDIANEFVNGYTQSLGQQSWYMVAVDSITDQDLSDIKSPKDLMDYATTAIDAISNVHLYTTDGQPGKHKVTISEETKQQLTKLAEEYTQKISSLIAPYSESGVYGLYANTDNFLVIDGNGSYWNKIKSDALPARSEAWTTRDVAKYAKEQGYSGVKFENIIDPANGTAHKPATVYAFFNPESQLKSADPVTYDNLGRVIPLDKRFNKDKSDIRYSERESLSPEQQKHFDYNEKQATVGSTLKTLKGSAIKRSTKYGVGKEIGGEIYFHKDYAEDIVQDEILSQAMQLLEEEQPGFEYNCLKYNPKTGVIAFQEAPDFDSAREPVVGDYVSVNTNTGVVKTGHSNYIWHHKWNWVKNDYSGFDVEESWNWSKRWLSTLTEVSDGNGIERWNTQLDKFGLPHDGEDTLYSDRPVAQKHTSAGTSINATNVPALYTAANKKGLFKEGDINIDIGAGRFETATDFLKSIGVTNLPFDPFNRTTAVNKKVVDFLMSGEKADTATCSNCLNVIDNAEARANVILEVAKSIKPDGIALFTVYENKKSFEEGKAGENAKKPDQWQEFRATASYVPEIQQFFDDVPAPKGGLIIARSPKKNLPKAAWQISSKESAVEPGVDDAVVMYSDRILMGSMFSGGGTLEAGLVYQMLDKEFGVEYDAKIASVYEDNHGDHIQVGKVEDFDISKYDDIFYLHASPVCHNFSKAKHGAKELEMDINSAKATAKHLETAMPQVFTVENAPGYRKSESLKIITNKLTELGYKWDVDVYNSADYGSATSRNRVILRAVKDGELPAKPAKQERTNSWDKVTRDLWDNLPKSYLRPSFISCIENTPKLNILDANGNVKVDKPLLILTTTSGHMVTYCWEGDICPTLTTKCGEARLVMPDGNIYAVTPEFMGRIQGLPDDYKYPKAKTRAFTIIGNGIPTHLTKAVVGGVLDSAYEQTHDGQALYQDRVEDSVSNRALLANAFEGVAQTPEEKKLVAEYKSMVGKANDAQSRLNALNEEIKKLSFAKGPRDTKKINELRENAKELAKLVSSYDKTLFKLEAAQPLQDVLSREKKKAFERGRQQGREALAVQKAKYEENFEKRLARQKLQKLVLDTVKWLSHPAKTDVKCPDILKKPYADFLEGIDLSSKRYAAGGDKTKNDLRLANSMDSLATAIEKVMLSQDPTQDIDKVLDIGYLDLPANFVGQLRDVTEAIKSMMGGGDYVVNTMTAAEVRKLSSIIRTINHAIKTMSKLYANMRFANIEELGFDTMEFIDALGEIEKTGGIKDFVEWDNALPYYAFKRFGKGGESVFEGLMDAQDKLAFLAKDIFDFREKAWTDNEAKAWSEDTHTTTLPNGTELTLTTADAMSIYCLSRRDQGIQHLLGGGVRVMGIQKGSKKAKDSRSLLTIKDVDAIISSLTDRQKAVAEAIQEFMSTTCAEWGNEISMKRFLTKEFTEKFYFPIESNDENLTTRDPSAQQSDLFRLLNISATKPLTKGANNEVIIRNIFDVFVGHASDMARLNAYGMALLDYMKWLNYREKTETNEGQIKVRGVRKSMEMAFGNAAKGYVLNLIKDVNGRPSDGGLPSFYTKMLRNAKTAMVGSSLRVATLQVTSYPRAALVLSPKSLGLGLTKMPNIEKAKKYCGIALWKSYGFYDTNISRSIEDQIKGVKDVKQKLIELSLKGAEWGDAITWGCLWNACEYEVAQTTKNKVGSEEFYQEVGKKLREVVYRTQVVDSTLTRSQMMRSKNTKAQELSAFMSEPTLSANILMDAGLEFSMEKRRTGSAKTAWKNTSKYIGRAVLVYGIGQLAAALLEGLWDAWRDDEDEEFWKKYLSAFGENLALDLLPVNKIPIISDIAEAALSLAGLGYFSSDNLSSTALSQTVSAVKAWASALSGESSTTIYNALYKSTRAISSFYGVSFSGVMREGVALWNNTAGAIDSTLKVRQYELSKGDLGNELYEAIISGDTRQADSLKAEFEDTDSMHSAVRKALRENDPRITEAAKAQVNGDPSERVRIQKLIIADGFDFNDVIAATNTVINELTPDEESTPKEKGFYTVEDFAKEIANGDQASAYEAKTSVIETAQKNGKTAEDAEKSFNSSAKSELKQLYMEGKLSRDNVISTLTTFCGVEYDDAVDYVDGMDFEKQYGFTYSSRETAYKEGKVSSYQLKTILMSEGGMTEEEANFQIEAYNWEMQGYENVTPAAVRQYNLFCASSDVPKDVYLRIRAFANDTENDTDANGKTINYSAMKKIIAEIDSQYGLTSGQKTAIARSMGWAEKNIQKYKTW